MATRRLRYFVPNDAASIGPDDFVFDAPGIEAVADVCAGIVLTDGDEQRATTLLSIGAPLVFLGEAALRDSTVVNRLVAAFGGECVGVYAPVRRQTKSWGFETASNADFKTVTPSHCEPAWEVLMADETPTGTLAAWWLSALRDLGATQFLVRPDHGDDGDLNICADLAERLGDALWLAPPADPALPLIDWVRYGRANRLALSDSIAEEMQVPLHEIPEPA